MKLGKINDIKKVKQLINKDLAICFGYHNLGIYDLKYGLIKLQILNNLTEKINIFPQYFILKEIDKNIIIFNNNRNCLNIINSIKGEAIAKFFDEEFEIISCKKINFRNISNLNGKQIKLNNKIHSDYYIIENEYNYYILKK